MTRVSRNRLDDRTSRRPQQWRAATWRVGLLGVALMHSVACFDYSAGERAKTGECPPDEICSPETPAGLIFRGANFSDEALISDDTVSYTAVGGTQTVKLETANEHEPLGEFNAICSTSVFSVTHLDPPHVSVHAHTIGSSYLRILDAQDGTLYDRLEIQAVPVQRVQVVPGQRHFWATTWSTASRPLFYGGAPIPWLARLTHGEDRLVDETLTFAAADGNTALSINPTMWDVAEILPSSDATRFAVVATTGSGATGIGKVELVHEIDRMEVDPQMPMPDHIPESHSLWVTLHGYTADDRFVHGLDWTAVAVDPNGVITDRAMMWGDRLSFEPDQLGTWQLEVSAANITRTWALTVIVPPPPPSPTPSPAALPQPHAVPEPMQTQGAPGWRARRRPKTHAATWHRACSVMLVAWPCGGKP